MRFLLSLMLLMNYNFNDDNNARQVSTLFLL